MKRIALVIIGVAGLGAALAACSDDPKKRPFGETCGDDSECSDGLCLAGVCLDPETDEDGDGLINRVEGALGSNPLNPDSDYDGIPDGQEVNGVDPRDTDNDGKSDVLESIVVDADQDCLPDELDPDNGAVATDLSPAVPALCSHVGVCGTSIGNVRLECDAQKQPHCIYTDIPTYEAEEATCDGLDNDCDGKADEGFRDSDGDGTADCADDDVDGDGEVTTSDNCPEVPNDGQEDADSDDLGDACDPPADAKVGPFSPASPSNDTSPTVSGSAEALSIVRIFSDSKCTVKIGEGAATAGGTFSFDVTFTGTGEITYYVQSENSAGLKSECELGGTFTVDATAPAAASGLAARATKWDETSATFDITGWAEAFAHVDIYSTIDCSGEPLTVTAKADGSFIASGSFANTTGALRFEVTDIAGNTSDCTAGPTLFGEVTVDTTQYGKPLAGVGVQFSYPDGSPISLLFTGDDGLAKETVFAGCIATTAIEANEGYLHAVTVYDLVPGQTVPVERPAYGIGLDRSDAVNYTWPELPGGTSYIYFLTSCGQASISLDGQNSYYVNYYGGCLGLTTFDVLAIAYDNNGLPLGYATSYGNPVPENSDHTTEVTFPEGWTTDYDTFSVTFENVTEAAPFEMSVAQYLGLTRFAGGGDTFFGTGEDPLEYDFAHLTGQTFDYKATASHISARGNYGVRGELGHVSTLANVVDFASFPPKVFDAGWRYTSNGETGSYTGFYWNSAPGLAGHVQAGIVEGSMYGQSGTIDWQLLLAPRGDSGEVAFPQLDPDFPSAYILDGIYYAYDDNVTWYDIPGQDSFGGFVDECSVDIVKCLLPAPKTTYTSCCSSNNRAR